MIMYDNTKVTVELRELIESGVNIWDFDYPSYYKDEEKKAFEQKVIDHFYFRQIGQETPARWLHYFRSRIREIMPYYIDIYKSVELFKSVEDPLESYNLTETYTETESGSSTSSGSSSSESSASSSGTSGTTSDGENEQAHSDTPQGYVANALNYISDATVTTHHDEVQGETSDTSESSATMTNTGNASNESEKSYELTRRGNIGVQPLGQEIKILREAYINVDMMIIDDLNDLFLKVY